MSNKHRGKTGKHSSGGKGPGYEYWGRRPMNGHTPSKKHKKLTHQIERARAKQQLRAD